MSTSPLTSGKQGLSFMKAKSEPKPKSPPLDQLITVCAECNRAACWMGEFYCEKYITAGTRQLTIKKLKQLALEHPHWWSKQCQN